MVPGVDVMAGLRVIKERLRDGEYESQFDFVVDLKNIVSSREWHCVGKFSDHVTCSSSKPPMGILVAIQHF